MGQRNEQRQASKHAVVVNDEIQTNQRKESRNAGEEKPHKEEQLRGADGGDRGGGGGAARGRREDRERMIELYPVLCHKAEW